MQCLLITTLFLFFTLSLHLQSIWTLSLSLCPSASWHSTLSLIAHNWVGGTVGRPRLCVQRASGQVNGALVVNRELSPSTGTEGGDNGPLSNLKRQSWVPFYPSSSPLSLFHRLTDRISCIATLQLSFSWLSEHGKWRGLEWQSNCELRRMWGHPPVQGLCRTYSQVQKWDHQWKC